MLIGNTEKSVFETIICSLRHRTNPRDSCVEIRMSWVCSVTQAISYAASLYLIFKHLSKGASVISFRKSASLKFL